MKLDLINSRNDPPPSYRVYDSVEDASLSSSIKGKTLVHLAPLKVKVRIGASKRLKTYANDRFDYSVVNHKGDYVFVNDRVKRNVSDKNSVISSQLESQDDDPIAFITSKPSDLQVHSNIRCYTLDVIKDKIHDHDEYTIAARIASKKVPAGSFVRADRGLESIVTNTSVGPGDYDVQEIRTKSVPNLIINTQERIKQPVAEEFLPLEKKLRLERMRAYRPLDGDRSTSPSPNRNSNASHADSYDGLNDSNVRTSSLSPSSQSRLVGGFDKMPRFAGPLYREEPFKKTTGLILGPDFDAKLNKRIPYDMSKSQSLSISLSQASVTQNIDVDVGKFFSMQKASEKSPVKYSAAFKSKAEVGMKIELPPTGTKIGPGSYPKAYKPSLVIKEPKKPSLAFAKGDKGMVIRKAAPDGYDNPRPFSQQHTKGPVFPNAGSTQRKIHIVVVAEKKMKQIYPQLISRKSTPSLVRSGSMSSVDSLGSVTETTVKFTEFIQPPPVPLNLSPVDFRRIHSGGKKSSL